MFRPTLSTLLGFRIPLNFIEFQSTFSRHHPPPGKPDALDGWPFNQMNKREGANSLFMDMYILVLDVLKIRNQAYMTLASLFLKYLRELPRHEGVDISSEHFLYLIYYVLAMTCGHYNVCVLTTTKYVNPLSLHAPLSLFTFPMW